MKTEFKTFDEIKHLTHDATGIANPSDWLWVKDRFTYYPVKKIEKNDDATKTISNLSRQNLSVIENALNAYWNDAEDQLSNGGERPYTGNRRRLGDIEKEQLQQRKDFVLPLLRRIEKL